MRNVMVDDWFDRMKKMLIAIFKWDGGPGIFSFEYASKQVQVLHSSPIQYFNDIFLSSIS